MIITPYGVIMDPCYARIIQFILYDTQETRHIPDPAKIYLIYAGATPLHARVQM